MSLPVRTLTKTLRKSPTDMAAHPAEKAAVPTQLPTRQSTGASALSDVAVPETDIREVSCFRSWLAARCPKD